MMVDMQPSAEAIDRAARAAFDSDKASGNLVGGSTSRHTYDNIPEDGRWNYRRLVRATFAALQQPQGQAAFTRGDLESDKAFRVAEVVLIGFFGEPGFEEEYADIYGEIINAVCNELAIHEDADQ